MTSKEFIAQLKDYLKKLANGTTFREWEYQTSTNISYSNLSESWDPDKFKGYEFRHRDGKYAFVLRPIILSDKEYLIVDCLFKNKTILNHWLDEYRFKNENNKTTLMDAYIMNYGGRQKNDAVEAAMNKVGAASSGIIYEVEDSEINFKYALDGFLDWVMLREMAKKYIVTDDSFAGIIERVKDSFGSNDYPFQFKNTAKSYVWITDEEGVIGNSLAHYEIIKRHGKIFVELHFESKKSEKDQFYNKMPPLPEGLEWFDWAPIRGDNACQSIRVSGYLELNDSNLIESLKEKLIFLENSIGDQIRAIITNNTIPPKKELNPGIPSEMNKNDIELNQILFGPPGTGKTYHSINKALEIIGKDISGSPISKEFIESMSREEVKTLFDHYFDLGRIVFTTFHQSMSYEDFVEGIKPQEPKTEDGMVSYVVEDGIFQKICINAAYSVAVESNSIEAESAYDFSQGFDDLVQKAQDSLDLGKPIKLETKNGGEVDIVEISNQGNIVVKHIGKENLYPVSKERTSKLNLSIPDLGVVQNIDREFRAAIGGSNSTAMWAVLNYIRKQKPKKGTSARKDVNLPLAEKKEIISTLKSKDYKESKGEPFVLIIDEINRGNVSSIFGELITLIEKDKRLGGKEELRLSLPYSKGKNGKFGVPQNLYIVGTMNTADRSVEALDTALRRRFTFVEMPPLYEELSNEYAVPNARISVSGKEVDLIELLKTINKRINILLDRDHLIGHSYFLSVKNERDLKRAFSKQIIPLLQEYFYGDYGKISLVLGEGFCKGSKIKNATNEFAHADNYETDAYSDKMVYTIMDVLNKDFNINEAINILLRKKKETDQE